MRFLRVLFMVLLFISVLNGCINQKDSGCETFFKNFTVEFEELLLLNNPVKLTCTITQRDFDVEVFLKSDVFIEVELPEGFELVSGTLKWQGHVDPNQTITHTVTIKAVKTGNWVITVWAGPSQNPRFDVENLYVTVTETSAEVFTEPFEQDSKTESDKHTLNTTNEKHMIRLTVLFKLISTLKNKNTEVKLLSLYYIKSISWVKVIE